VIARLNIVLLFCVDMAPNVCRYDALTDSWLTCPPLLLARSAAAAAFFKGCVFVAGEKPF
jgi:hypothetical protein